MEKPIELTEEQRDQIAAGASGGDIYSLIAGLLAGGVGAYATQFLKLWLDERKSRKVFIKHKGLEVTFSGGVSQKTIERNIQQFIDLKDALEGSKFQIEITDPTSDTSPDSFAIGQDSSRKHHNKS